MKKDQDGVELLEMFCGEGTVDAIWILFTKFYQREIKFNDLWRAELKYEFGLSVSNLF